MFREKKVFERARAHFWECDSVVANAVDGCMKVMVFLCVCVFVSLVLTLNLVCTMSLDICINKLSNSKVGLVMVVGGVVRGGSETLGFLAFQHLIIYKHNQHIQHTNEFLFPYVLSALALAYYLELTLLCIVRSDDKMVKFAPVT